jgi:hypothetical protein
MVLLHFLAKFFHLIKLHTNPVDIFISTNHRKIVYFWPAKIEDSANFGTEVAIFFLLKRYIFLGKNMRLIDIDRQQVVG